MSSLNSGRQPFNYENCPLNPSQQETRLLELLPGSRDDELQAKILVASLLEQPVYDAMSYCWGDSGATFRIVLNQDWYLPIRSNLRNALTDIRRPDRSMVLWTDAICINQKNGNEVGDQVGKMRYIYAGAQVVRAWIDHEVDTGDEVFREMPNVRRGEMETIRLHDEQFWSPAVSLLKAEYWKRLWIQQELILAREVAIHCRATVLAPELSQWLLQIPSDAQGRVRQTRDSATASLHQLINGEAPTLFFDGISYARSVISKRDMLSKSPFNLGALPVEFEYGSLLSLFSDTLSLRTSDSRDRVYGLLGIAIDFEAGDISVDYTLSVQRVYSQIADMCIKKYHNLMFLCYQPLDEYHGDLPTWLPAPEKHVEVLWTIMRASAAFGSSTKAHGAYVHADGLALSVRGVCVDVISAVPSDKPLREVPVLEWRELLRDCHRSKGPTSQEQESSFSNDEELVTLLFPWWLDEAYTAYELQRLDSAEQRAAVEKLFEIAEKPDMLPFPLDDIIEKRCNISELLTAQELQAFRCMWYALYDNKFVRTVENRLGLADYQSPIQAGDEIWALYGSPLPIVLRSESGQRNKYKWIGCIKNIPGLMKGEGLAKFPEGAKLGFKYQEREIRQIDIW
ncbi:hypothetical protein K432DRAFT_430751 [Lepidopterella palustris CBS 459.81]|uniref:Heterokaryon incompatibility domain-containing protein n=1 Tax=Lepidopterella palustris CBS 459.81 TaxID=1314670 RepID=A0A8E2DWN8_9PEZI|nr:hypothetical protein K432DRAFT_430751 [Lepidopterella palustris CBS 459.81]